VGQGTKCGNFIIATFNIISYIFYFSRENCKKHENILILPWIAQITDGNVPIKQAFLLRIRQTRAPLWGSFFCEFANKNSTTH
jgi:hypothetical protein